MNWIIKPLTFPTLIHFYSFEVSGPRWVSIRICVGVWTHSNDVLMKYSKVEESKKRKNENHHFVKQVSICSKKFYESIKKMLLIDDLNIFYICLVPTPRSTHNVIYYTKCVIMHPIKWFLWFGRTRIFASIFQIWYCCSNCLINLLICLCAAAIACACLRLIKAEETFEC